MKSTVRSAIQRHYTQSRLTLPSHGSHTEIETIYRADQVLLLKGSELELQVQLQPARRLGSDWLAEKRR